MGFVHLPCDSGSCDNYLFEADTQGLLVREQVCNYWAAQFGCGPECKSQGEVSNHKELKRYVDLFTNARVVLCKTPPVADAVRETSGLSYAVREYKKP